MITLKKLEEAVSIRRQLEALENRFSSLFEATLGSTTRRSHRGVSAATRAKLSATAKARWAKKSAGRGATVTKPSKKGGLTPAGRKKLSQLMKARWAARRRAARKK